MTFAIISFNYAAFEVLQGLLSFGGTADVHEISKVGDVSFQAIAWIQVFMESWFPHFYVFSAHFGGF